MHWSLGFRTNIILLLGYVAVITACFAVSPPPAVWMLLPFPLIGFAVGGYQARAVRTSPEAFLHTKSALQVRAAFMSIPDGKFAFRLMWLNAIAIVGVLFLSPSATGLASPSTILSALALGGLSRELITFPAMMALERLRRG